MKVEAIIIDGKKYVPVNGRVCKNCDLFGMSCTTIRYKYRICSAFDGFILKESKDGLEQMPGQVNTKE